MKTLDRWSLSGFFAILILGGLSHFVYVWSGECAIVGAFVPVNESVWEHLKMGYIGVLIFSAIEYNFLRNEVANYFLAKAMGVTVLSITILLIYYSYSFFTGVSILLVDISTFIIGVLFCQVVTHKIVQLTHLKGLAVPTLLYSIGLGVVFAFFTFCPPHYDIFKDTEKNTYGIECNDSIKNSTENPEISNDLQTG